MTLSMAANTHYSALARPVFGEHVCDVRPRLLCQASAKDASERPGASPHETELAIIGGGLCGFFLALLLAKAGRHVSVFEAGPSDPRGKFGFLLNSRGLRALTALDPCFLERVQHAGNPTAKLSVIVGGRLVNETMVKGTTILRSKLVEELQREAIRHADQISVRYSHKLLQVDFKRKRLLFQKAGSDRRTSVFPSRVVACDGNYSRVRDEIERLPANSMRSEFTSTLVPWGFSIRCINIMRELSGFDANTHYIYGDFGYLCKVAPASWILAVAISDTRSESFLHATEASPDNVAKLCGLMKQKTTAHGFADLVLTEDELKSFFEAKTVSGSLVDVSSLDCIDGWIALAGDAAHAVSPFAGEGANSSLEDAAILANTILNTNEQAFKEFDRQRCNDIRALHRIALYRNEGVSGSDDQKVDYLVDSILISLLRRVGFFNVTQAELMQNRSDVVKRYSFLETLHDEQVRVISPLSLPVKSVVKLASSLISKARGFMSSQGKSKE